MNGIVDALSKVANQSGPQLKWSQLYDYLVSFPDPPTRISDTFYTSVLGYYTAIDSLGNLPKTLAENALNSPSGLELKTEFRLAAGDVGSPASASDVDAVFTRTLAPNDLPGGRGNKVIIEQLKRTPAEWNTETPQCWAMIAYRYNQSNALPARCYQFTVKVPDNLSDVLTHTTPSLYPGWLEILAFKGTLDNANTQHRLAIMLEKSAGDTGMRFVVRFDLFNKNLAGGAISEDIPTALWRMESAEGSLLDGHVYDVYLYFDQRTPASDTTGVTSILIVDKTDNVVSMSDTKTGVATCGYDGAPTGRLSFHGLYTGGYPSSGTIIIEFANLLVLDKIPVAMPAP